MAKESMMQAAASLRALTYRISSSPPQQLPSIAPQIAASLWNCRPVLVTSGDAGKPTETAQTVTRFRSCILQLLQGRSIEERWAAIVLAKASVEAGGPAAISKATGWMKNLIAILKKNDPPTTKVLAIATLTRIFMLTWDDANLVREITTPTLPGFVQACIAAVTKTGASSDVLQTVLEAFATLLPRHPTIFRTYEGQIRALLLSILSSTPSNPRFESYSSEACHEAASQLHALLHYCVTKQGGPEKWDETLKATVTAAHSTCDRIFRSINESWKSNTRTERATKDSAGELELQGTDAAGLGAWHGMYAGAERLVAVLGLLQAHLRCSTSAMTSIRLGVVFDLLQRLLELNAGVLGNPAQFNPQISKDEREQLIDTLPIIHVAAIKVLDATLQRFALTVVPALSTVLEPLCAVFAAEHGNDSLRAATYRLMKDFFDLIGPSLHKDNIAELYQIIRSCCEDLLPSSQVLDRSSSAGAGIASPRPPTFGHRRSSANSTELSTAASDLLPALFAKLNQACLPAKLRTRMEQTAVLTKQKEALVAAVLNPHSKASGTALRPSLLPLLAREYPSCAEVEALLRPRFPVAGMSLKDEMGLEDRDESEDDVSDESDDGEADAVDGAFENGDPRHLVASPDDAMIDAAQPKEVYSTTPEQRSRPVEIQQLQKRPASPAEQHEEVNAKRLRAPPIASALASELAGEPVPGVGTAQAKVPSELDDSKTATQTAAVLVQDVVGAGRNGDAESDDSDFEIPPLTMESDSEVEEVEE